MKPTLKEAVEIIHRFHYRVTKDWKPPYEPDDYGEHWIFCEDVQALRVVLDELKRLQNQPERAYLREGEWCQK